MTSHLLSLKELKCAFLFLYFWSREQARGEETGGCSLSTKLLHMNQLMRLWHLSPFVNSIFKHACAAIHWGYTSEFLSDLRLPPYFMCANSDDSGETARIAWAFAVRLCDKYHNLMSWLIFWGNGGVQMYRTTRKNIIKRTVYKTNEIINTTSFSRLLPWSLWKSQKVYLCYSFCFTFIMRFKNE